MREKNGRERDFGHIVSKEGEREVRWQPGPANNGSERVLDKASKDDMTGKGL